jgi:hypothetical protein
VNRDKTDSVEAYQKFLRVWGEADQGQPLVMEVLTKGNGSDKRVRR